MTLLVDQMLLRQSEEEFGFYQDNGLTIPCDEDFFLSLISSINPPWQDTYERAILAPALRK